MNKTFETTEIAGIKLKNRIIRSATHEGMADERGFPTETYKKLYVRLAKGGIGAIITGYVGIQQDGKSSLFGMTMFDSDEFIPAYKEIVDEVHDNGTKIIMQIAHCGRQTRSKTTGLPTVAPSAIRDKMYNEDKPRELTESEINIITENFAEAALRSKKAGFDAVQLHLAHGYLFAQFLSSYSNKRKDKWGGTTGNKYRIIDEIFKKAKEKVGNYPVLVKMNAHDGRKNGMRISEAVKIAKMLEKSGCAAIEVSSGVFEDGLYTMRSEKLPVDPAMEYNFKYKNFPGLVKSITKPIIKAVLKQPKPLKKYNLDAAIKIKKAVNIPVIVVGGFNNIADIKDTVEDKGIDYISMSRPFIIEPNIVVKFKEGKQVESRCIMCNYCAIISEEKPLKCYYGRLPNIHKIKP